MKTTHCLQILGLVSGIILASACGKGPGAQAFDEVRSQLQNLDRQGTNSARALNEKIKALEAMLAEQRTRAAQIESKLEELAASNSRTTNELNELTAGRKQDQQAASATAAEIKTPRQSRLDPTRRQLLRGQDCASGARRSGVCDYL